MNSTIQSINRLLYGPLLAAAYVVTGKFVGPQRLPLEPIRLVQEKGAQAGMLLNPLRHLVHHLFSNLL